MDAPLQCLKNYNLLREKLKDDPSSSWVLLKECETIIEQIVQAHNKSMEGENERHNFSSCVICNNKEAFDQLINNKISVTIPESATGQEDEEPEESERGRHSSVPPSLCDKSREELTAASKTSDEDDEESDVPALRSSVLSETSNKVDEEPKGPANVSHSSVPSSLCGKGREDLTAASKTSDEDDEESEGSAIRSLNSLETSNEVDEKSEGDEVVVPEQGHNISQNDDYAKHLKEIQNESKSHEKFYSKSKKKILKKCNKRSKNCILTYRTARSKNIKYELFENEQQAVSWAYTNIGKFHRMKNCNPFILIVERGKMNKRALTTDDLAVCKLVLKTPLDSNNVTQKQALYDTGADIASFPYNNQIPQTYLNSATKLDGDLCPTVYGKLEIRLGDQMLNDTDIFYEIELDPDQDWCNLGNQQVADMKSGTVKVLMQRMRNAITAQIENAKSPSK